MIGSPEQSLLDNSDVRTRLPYLRGHFAVPTPPKNICTRFNIRWHYDRVFNDKIGHIPCVVPLNLRWEGLGRCVAGWKSRVLRVAVARARIVRRKKWGAAAWTSDRAMVWRLDDVVTLTSVIIWKWPPHPAFATTFLHNHRVDGKVLRWIRKADHLLLRCKCKWRSLKAGFRERLARFAQPKLVAAAVIGRLVPPSCCSRAPFPHSARRARLELRPNVPLFRVDSCVVFTCVERAMRRAARHAARIIHRSLPRCPPRIELPNVLQRVLDSPEVCSPVLWIKHELVGWLRRVGTVVKAWNSGTVPSARLTPDRAPLREPKSSLSARTHASSIGTVEAPIRHDPAS
eukprot:m.97510 g.97510  ORF g.97510 m.97510 type:complete len:344 (+) comp12401_c0_seq3:3475-4506(+)